MSTSIYPPAQNQPQHLADGTGAQTDLPMHRSADAAGQRIQHGRKVTTRFSRRETLSEMLQPLKPETALPLVPELDTQFTGCLLRGLPAREQRIATRIVQHQYTERTPAADVDKSDADKIKIISPDGRVFDLDVIAQNTKAVSEALKYISSGKQTVDHRHACFIAFQDAIALYKGTGKDTKKNQKEMANILEAAYMGLANIYAVGIGPGADEAAAVDSSQKLHREQLEHALECNPESPRANYALAKCLIQNSIQISRKLHTEMHDDETQGKLQQLTTT